MCVRCDAHSMAPGVLPSARSRDRHAIHAIHAIHAPSTTLAPRAVVPVNACASKSESLGVTATRFARALSVEEQLFLSENARCDSRAAVCAA
jgi:hypothetical protein